MTTTTQLDPATQALRTGTGLVGCCDDHQVIRWWHQGRRLFGALPSSTQATLSCERAGHRCAGPIQSARPADGADLLVCDGLVTSTSDPEAWWLVALVLVWLSAPGQRSWGLVYELCDQGADVIDPAPGGGGQAFEQTGHAGLCEACHLPTHQQRVTWTDGTSETGPYSWSHYLCPGCRDEQARTYWRQQLDMARHDQAEQVAAIEDERRPHKAQAGSTQLGALLRLVATQVALVALLVGAVLLLRAHHLDQAQAHAAPTSWVTTSTTAPSSTAPSCVELVPHRDDDPDGAAFGAWSARYDEGTLDYSHGAWWLVGEGRPMLLGYALEEDSAVWAPSCGTAKG